MSPTIRASALILTAGLLALASSAALAQPDGSCLAPGAWTRLDAAQPERAESSALLAAMARRDVVLLGEQHDDMDHHRWQLHTLAALHAQRPHMVIGFEMFPRRVQPVLDRWVAGELSEAEFLTASDWGKVWSMPAELYLPLFHFARLHRIPMVALNVEAALTRNVAQKGWNAVPEDEREGVGTPAPASRDYEDFLYEIHRQHAGMRGHGPRTSSRRDAAFRNFVDSQLTWDRAMAEALAAARKAHTKPDGDSPLAVGIMGSGHVRFGHGVAHQLDDLGVGSIGQLLPMPASTDCRLLAPRLADAVFAVPDAVQAPPPPPRLGVSLDELADGVRIAEVSAGSLAERSGLLNGDVITEAAGAPVRRNIHLIAAVRQQPPGTWLPLKLRRGDEVLELVVRFPAQAR
ncbi:MAG TPA: ChaN family lipoprotein [Thauera sp.]|nr:ChaN family lipoprotein [Thauera sp.]